VLVIALIVLIVTALGGPNPLGLGSSQSAESLLGRALDHWTRTPVIHETGSFSLDGHRYELDVTEDRRSDGQGTVAVDGRRVQYRYVSDHTFLLADQDWWANHGQPRLAGFVAGKWTTTPEAAVDLSTPVLDRSLNLLDRAIPGHAFTDKGPPTRVGGVPAVRLSDSSGAVYVSTVKPVRFLRLVSSASYRTADGVSAVAVDLDFPPAAAVQVPAPAVDTSDRRTLPAHYTEEPGSFKFASCETPSGCTLATTVRNQDGPQVGEPSVEFHLNRADGSDLGGCTAPIKAVSNDQTEEVSCTVTGAAWVSFTHVGGRYQGKATIHNPLYD
jgi:hypothetical protein